MNDLRLFRNIRLGIKSLGQHKLRSLLTVLGVVFGVGSVVAMLSVGEGASRRALHEILVDRSRLLVLRRLEVGEAEQR